METPPQASPPETPVDPVEPIPYVHYKTGHPRWNLVMVLAIIAVILAFALIEAQRLAGINP